MLHKAASEMPATPKLKPAEFVKIRDFALKTFGLDLHQDKEQLVSTRLGRQMRLGGFRSFDDYFQHTQSETTGTALLNLIDSLTTNHTSFLREPDHFQFLTQSVFPLYKQARQFSIWCAASSTGEEPYSLLFSMLDALKGASSPAIRLTATDISTRALVTARQGRYLKEKLARVPPHWVNRYLRRLHGESGWLEVLPTVRRQIVFRRQNLIEAFPAEQYAAIFCRNVMIYFNKETQQAVVNRLVSCLAPGGFLFVGHAESLNAIEHPLEYLQPAVYRARK